MDTFEQFGKWGISRPYRLTVSLVVRVFKRTFIVMAGHSASKTRVNALVTRRSRSERHGPGQPKRDARVKPAHDGFECGFYLIETCCVYCCAGPSPRGVARFRHTRRSAMTF